ncbi:hypothetical protein ACVWZZ_008541 [Bradyrhizobium sp. LM6.10]
MRMKIAPDAALFAEELRLRDPDAFVLLELCHFDHGESVFGLRDEMRRDMPAGKLVGRTLLRRALSAHCKGLHGCREGDDAMTKPAAPVQESAKKREH